MLPIAPSNWYLTGFLVPYEAPVEQRTDERGAQAHVRNVEAGVVVAERQVAMALRAQFETLAEQGVFRRIPGL